MVRLGLIARAVSTSISQSGLHLSLLPYAKGFHLPRNATKRVLTPSVSVSWLDFSLGRLITTSASIASAQQEMVKSIPSNLVTLAVEIHNQHSIPQSRQIPFATAALALQKQGYPQKRLATGGCTIWATRSTPVLRELYTLCRDGHR